MFAPELKRMSVLVSVLLVVSHYPDMCVLVTFQYLCFGVRSRKQTFPSV